VKSADKNLFDEAYYQRYYFNKKTSVADPEHVQRLGAFVCSYPHAQFHGVEFSEYLCGRFGWERGSVVDYKASSPFDLVICQGVLPYLSAADAKLAMLNLGRLSCGALYVEAVAREDWEQDIVDDTLTDPRLFKHRAQLYRQGLSDGFIELGGGVWLSRKADLPVFALERASER
jgi:hypothetical protein